ncbi:signal peptidase I [Flavobacterium ponti]|uniref:Signal peptidase I n=1 Tax=Flavobacterium ponti TaxID=665133 RepID=A0ABV9P240_9FLAO
MTALQWLFFLLIVQIIHGLGTWKLYIKAGRQAWEAFIPVYNAIVLMQIINRPKWYTFLLFIPIINLIMIPVVWVETIRSFGYNTTKDTLLVLVTLGFYIFYINYTQNPTYIADRSLVPTNKTADTISSILFAVVVATFVHTYFIQPFTIPTSSLEKSLLVGDFLFVSKYNYGARTPMTTIAAPMVHDTIPVLNTKSYSSWPQLPYFRLPGYEKIKNNDIVVFNWPIDTVYQFRDPLHRHTWKPIDKRSNYVKRCVGIPGDKIEVKNSDLYVNGKILVLPERAKPQFSYSAKFKEGTPIDESFLLSLNTYNNDKFQRYNNFVLFPSLTDESLAKLKTLSNLEEVTKNNDTINERFSYVFKLKDNYKNTDINQIVSKLKDNKINATIRESDNLLFVDYPEKNVAEFLKKHPSVISTKEITAIFPNNNKNWTVDNLGPIYIPEAGKTLELNLETLPFYKRLITDYEGNTLQQIGNEIRINGQVATTYTFKQDYYWMMGDNRHNSEDSRYWGYVPADHIVGKPIFIWMSWDSDAKGIMNKIRWERLFTTVSGEGQPQSYFKYFLILLAAYFAFDYFRGKKKKKV